MSAEARGGGRECSTCGCSCSQAALLALSACLHARALLQMRFIPLADHGARALVLAVASNCKYFAAVERVPGVDHDQVGD